MDGRDRAAAAFLLAVLACGCLALFVGVPVGVLWALSNLTDSLVTHFVLGLIGIPLLIAVLSPVLFWVNALYLRVTGLHEPDEEGDYWDEGEDHGRLPRGPLEPMLVAAFIVALAALIVWFFFFAENPVLTA